jgi:hypothetical protein
MALGPGRIVALTPQVAFSLDVEGKEYSILEDHYDETILRSKEDDFFVKQLKWMDGLDDIIKNEIRFFGDNDIAVIRELYYLSFKYIIDTVIIEAYILRKFIEKNRPKEISYFYNSGKRKNPLNLFDWMDNGSNFYIELLSLLAVKNDFSFTAIDAAEKKSGDACAVRKKANLQRIRPFIKRLAKSVFLSFKYNKYALLFQSKGQRRDSASILFLHSACQPFDFLIKDFLDKGANVFVEEDGDIYFENPIFRKRVLKEGLQDDKKHLLDKLGPQMKNMLAKLYEKGRLLDWVSEESGIDISSILRPFMDHFIEEIVARSMVKAGTLIDFYKKNNIEFVAARAGTDRNPVAGLLASRCVEGVKSVCFQHGCYALDAKALHITETGMFDIYFTTDDLSMKYFKEAVPPYVKNRCLVLQEPRVLQEIKNIKKKDMADVAGNVLYIPANHSYFLRCFNNMDYSATWYYRFQKDVIDLFGGKKGFTFIYKQPPGHNWCIDSIIAYIKDKGYGNIEVRKGPVPESLSRVEKVIVDSLSTPFFEAAAFGMPVLGIFRDYLPTWKPAMDHFGNSAQVFSENRDALKKIEAFLSSDPKHYFTALPMSARDTYETLLDIKGKRYD